MPFPWIQAKEKNETPPELTMSMHIHFQIKTFEQHGTVSFPESVDFTEPCVHFCWTQLAASKQDNHTFAARLQEKVCGCQSSAMSVKFTPSVKAGGSWQHLFSECSNLALDGILTSKTAQITDRVHYSYAKRKMAARQAIFMCLFVQITIRSQYSGHICSLS